MTDGVHQGQPLRSVIVGTLVVCLLVAIAPWMSGGQDPLALMISGGALLLGALLVWRQPEALRLRRGPLVVAWWVFIGFALLSLLWTANRYSSAMWVVQWSMAGLAFWLAYTVSGEKKGREWLIRGYLASVGIFCLAAVWIYLTGSYERLTGTFYWANPAATYLLPAVVIIVDRLRRARGKAVYGLGVFGGVVWAAFLLTDSRGALVVLALMMAVYLIVVATPKRFWIRFLFVIILGVLLSMSLNKLSTIIVQDPNKPAPGGRLAEAVSGGSNSLRDRLDYLESAGEMWFRHPILGVGVGAYGDVHPQYQQRVVSASTSAHNVYAQVLAELGLIGLVLLAGVLLWLAAGSLRGVVDRPEMFPVLLGVVGILLHFGLDIGVRYPALLMLVAVLVGMIFQQWRSVRGSVSWLVPVVAGLLLVAPVGWYQSDVLAKRAQIDQEDGDYDLAVENFAAAQRGVMYDPDLVGAEGINLYALAAGGGPDAPDRRDQALERAWTAQRMDPHDGQHHQLAGRVLAGRQDWSGAAGAFRRALELDPRNHPEYALDLASVLMAAGDTKGAVEAARAMLAQYPPEVVKNRSNDAGVRPAVANLEALVGNTYLQEGKLPEARQAAMRGLETQPGNLRARALLRQVELREQGAEQVVEQALPQ